MRVRTLALALPVLLLAPAGASSAPPRRFAADLIAEIQGSRGRTRVRGATLRARFGLFGTWASFSRVRAERQPRSAPVIVARR